MLVPGFDHPLGFHHLHPRYKRGIWGEPIVSGPPPTKPVFKGKTEMVIIEKPRMHLETNTPYWPAYMALHETVEDTIAENKAIAVILDNILRGNGLVFKKKQGDRIEIDLDARIEHITLSKELGYVTGNSNFVLRNKFF